jgi:hypothetical protein
MPLDADQLKQLKQLDERAQSGQMTSEDRQLLRALIAAHTELVDLLEDPDTTLEDLSPFLESYEQYLQAEDAGSEGRDSLPEKREE